MSTRNALAIGIVVAATMVSGVGSAGAASDAEADGRDDLMIPAPGEDIGSVSGAGAFHVLRGAATGLVTTAGQLLWHQDTPGITDGAETDDLLGWTHVWGDFDGDGFDDLAVGAPGDTVQGQDDAGVVHVFFGSASGLRRSGAQLWHQNVPGIADVAETDDWFGASLAAGDFDADGRDDLAVGVYREAMSAGVVHVIRGSATGLVASGAVVLSQDTAGVPGVAQAGEVFGYSLATGRVNGDAVDDLVIGVPGERVGGLVAAGAVNVLYGAAESGISGSGARLFTQDSENVAGVAEAGDAFGLAVGVGDLTSDGRDDLLVGAPGEQLGTQIEAGAVTLLRGTQWGPTGTGSMLLTQDTPGVAGAAENGDSFGSALEVGDYNGDGIADVAIAAPSEDLSGTSGAGMVTILYGGPAAFASTMLHENVSGLVSFAAAGETFGGSMAAGDFDGDGDDDLFIGVGGTQVNGHKLAGAGHVVRGTGFGLTGSGSRYLHQDAPGVAGVAEFGDRFGHLFDT